MIRQADLADVPALVKLGCRFIAETSYVQHIATNPEQQARLLEELVLGERSTVLVAERDGAVVGMIGFIVYGHFVSGEVVAGEVFWWVNPDQRGSLGVRLLKAAEQWARDMGASKVQMIAPTERVGQIYAALGYQAVETTYQRSLS